VETPSGILIWGAGGHGKVVADLIRACGHRVAGFIDADERKLGTVAEPGGACVTLSEADLVPHLEAAGLPAGASSVVCAIADNSVRSRICLLLGRHLPPALVHPTAVVSPSARIGVGTVVFPGAVINANASVGDGVIINSAAVVEHDCVIGAGTHVSPGVVLAGGVILGAATWIGAGATIIPLVHVGAAAVVGAGAVVLADVPPGTTVVGVPARAIVR
jgi:sugar O-acyltransferase (sialic acid O-acetyltransferase NeuD family)